MSNRIDIGHDHEIAFTEYKGERAGLNVFHKRKDGSPCQGHVSFEGGAWANEFNASGNPETKIPTWKVVSWEPLTLTPSLLCRICGDHGYITDGKWNPV